MFIEFGCRFVQKASEEIGIESHCSRYCAPTTNCVCVSLASPRVRSCRAGPFDTKKSKQAKQSLIARNPESTGQVSRMEFVPYAGSKGSGQTSPMHVGWAFYSSLGSAVGIAMMVGGRGAPLLAAWLGPDWMSTPGWAPS